MTKIIFWTALIVFCFAVICNNTSHAAQGCHAYARHCLCLHHGPQGGCVQWTCRRICRHE
jgi:hypothetical protein